MSIVGIGGKLAIVTALYLVIAIAASSRWPHIFLMLFLPYAVCISLGSILLAIGLIFYVKTLKTFVAGFREGKLITSGTFALCRNPIYATWVVFLFPAIGFFCRSWLVLTTALVAYIVFKVLIPNEYKALEALFGEDYRSYRANVPELLPLPWLFSKKRHTQT